MPKPLKRLNKEVHYTNNWFALCATRRISEVTDSLFKHKFVVDFQHYLYVIYVPLIHAKSNLLLYIPCNL